MLSGHADNEGKRNYASVSEPTLKEALRNVIPAKRELLKQVKSKAGMKNGDLKVENTLGGMRYGLIYSKVAAG